jgi:hypothetical protein
VRKDTRKYQTSSATLKLIEMLWYQCSFQQTYLVKPPQIPMQVYKGGEAKTNPLDFT